VPDTLEATLDVIQKASEKMDLIITSGGVSVGEEDYVRIALEQLGKLELWRIAMKPGKPVAFGKVGKTLFLGLPGNPVAVFVTAQIFACPLIRKLQGRNEHFQQIMIAKSGFDWPAVKRQEYLRVQLIQQGGEAVAQLYPHQGSGVLSSASWANGLVIVPVDQAITMNDTVDYIALL
ncbi:MAG: molybdopterin molybdenumtransferase MoeA, partial [Gammaproteobacteria bacterium]|nr:molybdopterin molybdenumtransferase MoeA [Gammaproteobacteria bacterium]